VFVDELQHNMQRNLDFLQNCAETDDTRAAKLCCQSPAANTQSQVCVFKSKLTDMDYLENVKIA